MSSHEVEDLKRLLEGLAEKIDAVNNKVEPMYDAYVTVKNGSVWFKYLLYTLGAVLALAISIRELFKK